MKQLLYQVRAAIAASLRLLPGDSTLFGPPRRYLQSTPDWFASLQSHHTGESHLTQLRDGYSVLRAMPAYADSQIANIFKQMCRGRIKDQFVVSLQDGRHWGRCYGYIINSNDCLHSDLSPSFGGVVSSNTFSRKHDGLTQLSLPPLVNISGVVASVNTLGSHNFHHWLLDCVPRFGLFQDAGFALSNFDAFILPSRLDRWHREVLDRLDIPSSKFILSHAGLHLRADHLIVPSFSEPNRQPELFNYTPEGLSFVRKLFLADQKHDISSPLKIIVSREKAKTRRLLSNGLVYEQLESLGFVKIYLEDFSISEQALFFSSAKTIIMPTGGGLANIAFCQPGTQVIELFDPSYLPTFSHLICLQLGLEYHALVGENHTGSAGHSDSGAINDMYFQDHALLDYVSAILK